MAGNQQRQLPVFTAIALAVVLILFVLSMLIGAGDFSMQESFQYLMGDSAARADEHLNTVMATLRFPRGIVALGTGAALGVAGCLLQSATRNPLAETGLLGVNSGAALVVVIGITFLSLESAPALLLFALIGALLASFAVLAIAASSRTGMSPLRLVLAGIALSATFRGATTYLLLEESNSYDRYRFWVMGSLSGVTMRQALWILPIVVVGFAIAAIVARPLGALALGDDVAAGLGHRPQLIRLIAGVSITLLTGAAVALCGPIAFLGLLAPYLARLITGAALGAQLIMSALGGAAIMLLADIAARIVIAPYEAPVSVLLAVIGGPMLIIIVRYRRIYTLRTAPGAS